MRRSAFRSVMVFTLWALAAEGSVPAAAQDGIPGERLEPAACGPSWVESMDAAIERNRHTVPPANDKERQPGEHGAWMVPSVRATTFPHSGRHNAVNKWGDTRMGIGFPQPVTVHGAYFAGQAGEGVWTPGVRVAGYRDGQLVGQTGWLSQIGREPRWLEMNLAGVDRIEVVAVPAYLGGGWYGMDDLTYAVTTSAGETQTIVIDFEDLPYDYRLTGSGYAGLTWEEGRGEFSERDGIHGPLVPPEYREEPATAEDLLNEPSDMGASAPELNRTFQGVLRGDAGSMSYPPDTDGAVGPRHYVETVNRNFAVYDKATGAQLVNILLGAFLPGSNGDPRTVFDHHSGRWIVHVTDFSATATVFLAVSLTDDPTGDWFKTSFKTNTGGDEGRWPDYPTLGVDAHGIYITAYMVGGSAMTIFALDKAPLVATPPSLGTITAWRNLPFEGAIQPAHTYGDPGGEYLVSRSGSSSLRIRRVNPPLNNPTLTEVGLVSVSSFSAPPDAPALGSTTPLDTVDQRLMMSVYRGGSLWTCHTINVSGRAGCRWYEVDPVTRTVKQWGNVADPVLYYFFPSIMVNADGDVVMAFTGSSSAQYAGCYYTGRRKTDPPGEMAPPVQYKPGTGPQNNIDSYGRNRWGDYSYTTLDPVDQTTFYTIQEYGHDNNIWGTYVAVLGAPPDCNNNGLPDKCDLDCGPPGGPCDLPGCGQSTDLNGNGIPDECDGLGDLNCDGWADFGDINPFVLRLSNPVGYAAQYPNCPNSHGDINGDGFVDFGDINPFVRLLTQP
ncbi:MAG: hypothetical protein AB1601_14575 [Planctomycetota bacterium]